MRPGKRRNVSHAPCSRWLEARITGVRPCAPGRCCCVAIAVKARPASRWPAS